MRNLSLCHRTWSTSGFLVTTYSFAIICLLPSLPQTRRQWLAVPCLFSATRPGTIVVITDAFCGASFTNSAPKNSFNTDDQRSAGRSSLAYLLRRVGKDTFRAVTDFRCNLTPCHRQESVSGPPGKQVIVALPFDHLFITHGAQVLQQPERRWWCLWLQGRMSCFVPTILESSRGGRGWVSPSIDPRMPEDQESRRIVPG